MIDKYGMFIFLLKIIMVLFFDRFVWVVIVFGGGFLLGEVVVDKVIVWVVLLRIGGINDWFCF